MFDKSIADLINYSGDPDEILYWDFLPNKSRNALNRMFSRFYSKEDFWADGITFNHLKKVAVSELFDTNSVGPQTGIKCLNDLSEAFSELETRVEIEKLTLSTSNLEEIETEPYLDAIDLSGTIEELQDAVISQFNDYIEIDERNRAILHGRHTGLMRNQRSLDDLGKEFGVTRERIRQIESKFLDLELGTTKTENYVLEQSIKILCESNSIEEFSELMQENGIADYEYLATSLLKSLCKILGLTDYIEQISEQEERIKKLKNDTRLASNRIRKYRNKIGLLDIKTTCTSLGLNHNQFNEALKIYYPRSMRFNNACLARTNQLDTAFENVLFKQLVVAPNLDSQELLVGIKRHASYRGENTLVADQDLVGIIGLIAGTPPNIENLRINMLSEPELSESEQWIVKTFQNAPNGILHRNEVTHQAIKSGLDFTSAGVYLSTSMLIRPLGSGLFKLIGVEVSEEQRKLKSIVHKSQVDQTQIIFNFENELLVFQITPNSNAINGVIFPPNEIKKLFKNIDFQCECSCGSLSTNQMIKITETNFLTGFSAIFKHGLTEHDLDIGETFEVAFDFNSKVSTLRI